MLCDVEARGPRPVARSDVRSPSPSCPTGVKWMYVQLLGLGVGAQRNEFGAEMAGRVLCRRRPCRYANTWDVRSVEARMWMWIWMCSFAVPCGRCGG